MRSTATESLIGKCCPFCQTPIKPDTAVNVCDECGIPHHSECWQDNGGCTTFGCASRAATASAASVANPLIEAVAAGELERVRQLLRENPQWLNTRDADGHAALHWAVESGQNDIARALISAGAESLSGDRTALRVAGWGRRFINFLIDTTISRLLAAVVASWVGSSDSAGVIALAALPLYYVAFEAAFQKTPGKFLTCTRVVSLSGDRPTITQVIGRSLSRFVPLEPIAGALGDGWWHDKWSGTAVVRG